MINLNGFSESLSFHSMEEWETFCQDLGWVVPVYFWQGEYKVIVENISYEGEHGAVMLGDDRHAITHYKTPGGGMLSYHWTASYRRSYTESSKYWVFTEGGKLPQEINRGNDYWLRSYRQTDHPGLYEAVTEEGIPHPILRKKPEQIQ